MANFKLFPSRKQKQTATDTYNEAGGRAYTQTPAQQLAQLATTSCREPLALSAPRQQHKK